MHRSTHSDSHWLSGDIQVDQKGHASIFLADSMGYDSNEHNVFFNEEIIKNMAATFPQCSIYYSKEHRQHAPNACQAFALDDVRHLFTVDRYLEKKYESSGLHGYLANQQNDYIAVSLEDKKVILVKKINLPSSLVRTMQSTELGLIVGVQFSESTVSVNKILTNEQAQSSSKRKKSAAESALQDFRKTNPLDMKFKNMRLSDKLRKMANQNAVFLMTIDEKTIQDRISYFTLDGFKRRIKKPLEPNASFITAPKVAGSGSAQLNIKITSGDDRPVIKHRK